MFARAAWTWIVAAALGVVSLGILIRVTLGLLARLKALTGTLQGASGQMQESLDNMRGDLDRAAEGLAALRERREDAEAG
ncbi:MAG: hypothetical protein ACRDHK_12745 [Actinomycetota bacterium]